MKLYSYDHCPYCVKARMIFGFKDVSFELQTLLNDDEQTPISMIGQKMLPILQKEDGSYLPESLDIIEYIDNLDGKPVVEPSRDHSELNQWLKDIRQYHYALAMPRWVRMGLPEFATEAAVAYFTNKKEKSIGPFSEAVANTNQFIKMAEEHLPQLEKWLVGTPYFWGEEITLDDFHVFASLRCLTTTQGIRFPERVDAYMNKLSELSQVPLHWELALSEGDLNG